MSAPAGYLTTHVLDTANGCPAEGIEIRLYRIDADDRSELARTATNADGRTDEPLIAKGQLRQGVYELIFSVGDYFSDAGTKASVPFIDTVPIRFGIDDEDEHYHVPLLVSPYSYATYRGS